MTTRKIYSTLFSLLALFLAAAPATAQYDDVYFSPSEEDFSYYDNSDYDDEDREEAATTRTEQLDATDAASDYEYASRIRRFRRPVGSFSYYDPYYVDAGYYDPYYLGGASTTLIYNTPTVSYARVLTPYGPRVVAVDRFGFGSPYGFGRVNSFNDPFFRSGFNRYGYVGLGAYGRPVGAFGISGGLYCPPSYYGGNSYLTPGGTTQIGNRNVTTNPGAATSIRDRINRTQSTRSARINNNQKSNNRYRQSTNTRRTNVPARTRTRSTTTPRTRTSTIQRRSNSATRSNNYTPQRQSNTSTRTRTPSRSATTPSNSSRPTATRSTSSRTRTRNN